MKHNSSYGNNETESKKINEYIKLMINIFIFQEELKNKINKTLSQSNKNNYFCIRKKWVNEFKDLFYYNKFLSDINKGNILDIIKEYKSNNNDYNKLLEDIMKLLTDDFINKCNEISKDKEKIKKYFSNKRISLEIKNKNNIYYYNDEIEIINDKVKNIIQKLYDNETIENHRFLFGDRAIIMEFDIMPQSSIIIGKYNNECFEPNILLRFNKKENMKNYFDIIHNKFLALKKKELNFENNFEINLVHNSNIIGKAFKIKELDNNQIKDINNNIVQDNNSLINEKRNDIYLNTVKPGAIHHFFRKILTFPSVIQFLKSKNYNINKFIWF